MAPSLIIHNAKIYTVDPAQPWAEALACAHGRVVAVGTNAAVLPLAGPATQRLDAGGRLVLPGLTDAHVHFLAYAVRQQQVNLFGMTDFAEVRERVQQAVAQAKPGQWVQGYGWDENMWQSQPDPDWLNQVAPTTPVALARVDMHTWWVNQTALDLAGINRATPDPPQSRIEREASGRPTGLLREWNAIRLVEQVIPEPAEASLHGWLKQTIGQAHQLGLTAIHDQRVEREGRQSWRLWQALEREGELRLRVHANLAADYLAEVTTLGLQPGFGSERLWLGHLKAFADGTLGSRTAHMLAPFEGEPNNTGLVVTSTAELADLAARANAAGFSLSVHAIGDRAVREVIDVMSEFPADLTPDRGRLPHRLEHVQVIHPADLPRLAAANIVASMQPVHLRLDWLTADRLWGERARLTYAFRSLLDQGTRLAFGSDAPVAPLNPMLGLHAAVTRQTGRGEPTGGWYPAQRISLAEAIEAYTLGPAYLAGKQHRQGSLRPGKWADLIVLSQNLFEIAAEEIAETQVELTVFGGEVVYEG